MLKEGRCSTQGGDAISTGCEIPREEKDEILGFVTQGVQDQGWGRGNGIPLEKAVPEGTRYPWGSLQQPGGSWYPWDAISGEGVEYLGKECDILGRDAILAEDETGLPENRGVLGGCSSSLLFLIMDLGGFHVLGMQESQSWSWNVLLSTQTSKQAVIQPWKSCRAPEVELHPAAFPGLKIPQILLTTNPPQLSPLLGASVYSHVVLFCQGASANSPTRLGKGKESFTWITFHGQSSNLRDR